MMRTIMILAIGCCAAATHAAPTIAPTAPLTPAEQIKKFHLPPGFEIQLVASEPHIQKPMNLNFDSRGRLWVTHSIEYPFPAKDPDKARDGVTILSDIGANGKAKTITHFADKLNIPIGIVPINGGTSGIVWSIPNIWRLTDTDKDGKADKREVLYGPFGHVDTHGNQNAFTRGYDGWIYACHGFKNHSKIKLKGRGDVVLQLQSGNTYRFKPDGSAIEQFTHGQTNPFGLCFDANGDIFTADCHSKPVTMLLRGAHYPSFGKPHDGLGFAPQLTNDSHGSTGIGGIAFYQGYMYPKEFRGCLYVGNVITNRVHRDELKRTGSSYVVEKPSDFLTCDDPWFHPVDILLGPDGALYIADFYNRIIGHYEVALDHPHRDRHRGRIWRVVYKSDRGQTGVRSRTNFEEMRPVNLIGELSDGNIVRQQLAFHELVRRGEFGDEAIKGFALASTYRVPVNSPPPRHLGMTPPLINKRASGVWLNHRLGTLDTDRVKRFATDHSHVRRQLVKALAQQTKWDDDTSQVVRDCLKHADPFLQRFAADALGQHPDKANIKPLLKVWSSADAKDTFLIHTIRMALRDQLHGMSNTRELDTIGLNDDDLKRIIDISLAVPTEQAAWFTFEYLRSNETDQAFANRCIEHVAKHLPADRVNDIVPFVQTNFVDNINVQWSLFESIHTGLEKRGVKPDAQSAMGQWLTNLAPQLLRPQSKQMWTNVETAPSPWGLRERKCDDGKSVKFIDSIVNGEQLTGTLRSHPFTVPKKLSFYMCGHNGHPAPGSNPPPVNHIRLIIDGKTVAKEIPPRNDTARKYTWDLSAHKGKRATIEVIDADTASGYAWIGVARFDPPIVSVHGFSPSTQHDRTAAIVKQIGNYRLVSLSPQVAAPLRDKTKPANIRIAAANTASRLGNFDQTLIAAIIEATQAAPAGEQLQYAHALCSTRDGASSLLDAIGQGKASPRLLQDRALADRFNRVANESMKTRSANLLKSVPDLDARLSKLITQRKAGYAKAKTNVNNGNELFIKHCSACHRIGDNGATSGGVAPNLDGIHNRGAHRLIEDILDPNRNVDQAFRLITIETSDGENTSGFGPREEGKTLVMSDLQGKPVRIPLSNIESRKTSTLSPMPANVSELMREQEFYDLLAWLSQR